MPKIVKVFLKIQFVANYKKMKGTFWKHKKNFEIKSHRLGNHFSPTGNTRNSFLQANVDCFSFVKCRIVPKTPMSPLCSQNVSFLVKVEGASIKKSLEKSGIVPEKIKRDPLVSSGFANA